MQLDAPAGEKMAVFVSHAFVLYLNPLPVPHIDGPFLFGPNRFFRDYLEGRNIAFEDQELQVDFSSMNEMGITIMEEWNKIYMGEAQSKLSVFNNQSCLSSKRKMSAITPMTMPPMWARWYWVARSAPSVFLNTLTSNV